MFTFSFGSAFAYVPYDEAATGIYIAEVEDFYGYTDSTTDNGTYGITEVERARLVYEINERLDAVDGTYAAPAQAKVDEALTTALETVKAAKTNKEAMLAKAAYEKVIADNADYTYEKLKSDLIAAAAGSNDTWEITVELDEAGYYSIPGYGTDYCGTLTTVNVANLETAIKQSKVIEAAFEYVMDKGLYGYTTDEAWLKAVTGKQAKAYIDECVSPYWIGTETVEDAVLAANSGDSSKYAALSSYGKSLYMEYTGLLNTVYTFNNTVAIPSIDEVTVLIDKLNAFNKKYDAGSAKFVTTNTSTAPTEKYQLDGRRVGIAAENWNSANLDAATTALGKINTTSGYIAAKADILAAAKTMFEAIDKYAKYESKWGFVYGGDDSVLVNDNDVTQIVKALEAIMLEEGSALTKAQNYTEKIKATTGWDFDDSDENVAALENARKLFDAYIADYAAAYTFVADYGEVLAIEVSNSLLPNGTLKNYEAKLLAGEYNKAKTAAYKDKDAEDEAKYVQAVLDNATVKVTTQALGNRKIRVQAKIDAASFDKLAGYTIEYKFYKKTAKAASYKGYSDRAVNYTTFTKLTKGTKYNFKCAVTVKDKDGNVLATKGYLGSTTGIRTAK